MGDSKVVKYDERGVMDGGTMGLAREMSRDIWLKEVFPEWGTYLNHEIDQYQVPEGVGALWYLGAMSCVLKSQSGAVFTVDLYSGPSIFTDKSYCGVCKTAGAEKLYWMRTHPMVIDPWKFKRLDAVCVTHHHQDHMDYYTISAALQTTNCKFIAPPEAARRMKENMNVPEDRLIVAKVGESVQIEDMKIDFAPNFDVIATKTGFDKPVPYSQVAVGFIFNTQGGNFAFLGDSLYHNGYRMVGEKYKVDVVSMAMGNNAPGYTDKMSPWDLWRVAEALNTKVILPMHHDNWANCYEKPEYLEKIVKWKNAEKRHPPMSVVSLLPGAKYIHPTDNDGRSYMYPDNRELCCWEHSEEYGPDSDIGK